MTWIPHDLTRSDGHFPFTNTELRGVGTRVTGAEENPYGRAWRFPGGDRGRSIRGQDKARHWFLSQIIFTTRAVHYALELFCFAQIHGITGGDDNLRSFMWIAKDASSYAGKDGESRAKSLYCNPEPNGQNKDTAPNMESNFHLENSGMSSHGSIRVSPASDPRG